MSITDSLVKSCIKSTELVWFPLCAFGFFVCYVGAAAPTDSFIARCAEFFAEVMPLPFVLLTILLFVARGINDRRCYKKLGMESLG